MESKKQLIIIPPMSEALKKLNEVLEGISTDENMEISIIDDLKELSQFLATTGQCLVLASNAKKCATFLQDNKAVLAKHHCKTILFTPKEIPAKTLVKFTKIGLTESILESSPPKTFLYKVKLLLRSIKTAKAQDDGDKLVKSLDAKTAEEAERAEKEIKEKKNQEENVIDMGFGKKKNDENAETIDYGSNLKGKVKPSEESIDTHWKSDRKKDAVTEEEEEGNLATDSTPDSIDMYYRSKRKKTEDAPVEEAEEKKKLKVEEAPAEEKERRKNNYEDVIDEGSMKSKKLDQAEEDEEDLPKEKSIELDLIEAKKKRSKLEDEEESGALDFKSMKMDKEEEEKENGTIENDAEDLGGYLKGKISKIKEEEAEPEIEADAEYDNSELEEEKEKSIDLDLVAGDPKRNKKDDIEEEDEKAPHEGEVDHLGEEAMNGSGKVDRIKTHMTSNNSGKAKKEEKEDLDDFFARMEKLAEEQEKAQEQGLDLIPAAKEALEKEQLAKAQEEDDDDSPRDNIELDLIAAKDKEKDDKKEEESRERNKLASKSVEKEEKDRDKKAAPIAEEKELGMRNLENAPEKKRGNNVHNGQVDKIDTFYRSNESTKPKDQNWDNLNDRNTSLDLEPAKNKKNDGGTQKADKLDLGEVTIDYKKLKQEFDMLGSGIGPDGAPLPFGFSDTALKNNDDDGSFKVIEVDPKSLDFSISIINAIYSKDMKAKQIYSLIAVELVSSYHCIPVFYTFKLSDMKFTEVYNPFLDLTNDKISAEKKEWWHEFKKDTVAFELYQSKSMTTWRCPSIIKNDEIWEDVELPTWAEQELKDKHVELIFPYFDGIDRMGMAVVFLPDGINPKDALGILTTLEMARTLFLDTIQRYQVQPVKEALKLVEEIAAPVVEEKKGLAKIFGGLFGKKKAG